MFDASNCGGSAWIAAGAEAKSARNRVGGVSIPSTVAKARSCVDALALRWIVDLSGSATGVALQLPFGALVSAARRPDTSSRYLTHSFDLLAETSSTAWRSLGTNTVSIAGLLPA